MNAHKMQKTITYPVVAEGVGIHSGVKTSIRILPAGVDEGIVFVRTDIKLGDNTIKADYKNFSKNSAQCSILANENKVSVSTVEHIMCALWVLGICNIRVEIDGPEVPILDGSSEDFMMLLKIAGPVKQQKCIRMITLKKSIKVEEGGAFIKAIPSNEIKIKFTLDYAGVALLKNKVVSLDVDHINPEYEFTRARTFITKQDLDRAYAAGLVKGGSTKNALVIDNDKIIVGEKYRYDDEPVRHKILDFFGDLYLSQYFIVADFECYKSGHVLNNLFLKELFASENNYLIHD